MYGGSDTIFVITNFYSFIKLRIHYKEVFPRCLNTLWTHNHSNHTGWVQIRYNGKSSGNRCFHQSHAFGNKMLLTGSCSNEFVIMLNPNTLFEIICEEDRKTSNVWIYDPITITWLQLTAQPHIKLFLAFYGTIFYCLSVEFR